MEPQTIKPKASAKDFFLHLGAIVALFTTVVSLINLLFTVINTAYPQITAYYYGGTASISFPVATLIIFFPIYILLMWLLQKSYRAEPEKRQLSVRKWLTYITLFIAGLTLAGDLVTILYYFIDGQELTAGFILKIVTMLVLMLGVFLYYISDIREKLTSRSRLVWLVVSTLIILGSVVWGFSVIGSPYSQRLAKYDQQRISDLQQINGLIVNYFQIQHSIPDSVTQAQSALNNDYMTIPTDPQTSQPYEYHVIGQSAKAYQLCAEFNKASSAEQYGNTPAYMGGVDSITIPQSHPAGHYCFKLAIPVSMYPAVEPAVPAK